MAPFTLMFFGGAEKVTGSQFLVESASRRILVDCGIEQGSDYCETCNYEEFPYDPASLNALVITHAHLDHVGRAPKLVKDGFRGPVFMTEPTRDLSELVLRDSVGILAGEAKTRNTLPLYEKKDVELFLSLIQTIPYGKEFDVAPGISAMLRNTGHILGSASVRMKAGDGAAIAITSDIGNSPSPLLPDREPIPDADAIVMESVYGDRKVSEKEHRIETFKQSLKSAVARAQKGDGTILIPAFSIERTQLLLYELSNFFSAHEVPDIPVFLDSPLAISVTDVYRKHAKEYFKKEVQEERMREGDVFTFPFLTLTRSREESEHIAQTPGPKIVIAGAGMSHGGRITGHEIRELSNPASTLFIVGYQAPGSPGRLLQDGAPRITLHRKEIAVRAKVETLHGWSAHADRDGLLAFAESCLPRTKTFFTALGEPASARFLAQRIHDFLGVRAIVPREGEIWMISKNDVRKIP